MINKSPIFISATSGSMFASLESLIKENKLLFVFPLFGDQSFREKRYSGTVFFRPTFKKRT